MNIYVEEQMVRDRVADARALAARLALVRGLSPARGRIRVAFGHALIRVGHWMAGLEQRPSHARPVTT